MVAEKGGVLTVGPVIANMAAKKGGVLTVGPVVANMVALRVNVLIAYHCIIFWRKGGF
jgi:hypothetical protein